jgi:CBS domain-containing protein
MRSEGFMTTATKPLLEMTANDLMTPDVVKLREGMPLRDAAQLLVEKRIGGAPVVDKWGKCVGVLTARDYLRLAADHHEATGAEAAPRPVTCGFQEKQHIDSHEATMCTLPPGACAVQARQTGPNGEELTVCTQPNCVLCDWQIVEVEKLPTDSVSRYMTANTVTVTVDAPIRDLARKMIDAAIHRIIVVDAEQRPVGIVSSTDLLAALAYAE